MPGGLWPRGLKSISLRTDRAARDGVMDTFGFAVAQFAEAA